MVLDADFKKEAHSQYVRWWTHILVVLSHNTFHYVPRNTRNYKLTFTITCVYLSFIWLIWLFFLLSGDCQCKDERRIPRKTRTTWMPGTCLFLISFRNLKALVMICASCKQKYNLDDTWKPLCLPPLCSSGFFFLTFPPHCARKSR